MASYNTSVHSSTGRSPNDVVMNVKPTDLLSVATSVADISGFSDKDVALFAGVQDEPIDDIMDDVAANDVLSKVRMIDNFKSASVPIGLHDVVRMHSGAGVNMGFRKSKKFKHTWLGPLRVSKIIDDHHVELAAMVDIDDASKDTVCIETVNINRLARWNVRPPELSSKDDITPKGLTSTNLRRIKISSLVGQYILIDAKNYNGFNYLVGYVESFDPGDGTFAVVYDELSDPDDDDYPLYYFENLIYKSANYKVKRAKREDFCVICKSENNRGWEYDDYINKLIEAPISKERFSSWLSTQVPS